MTNQNINNSFSPKHLKNIVNKFFVLICYCCITISHQIFKSA